MNRGMIGGAAIVCGAAMLGSAPPRLSTSPAAAPGADHEWLLVYVMSYDNNLDHCTKPITDGLGKGLVNGSVAVAILSDGVEEDGLRYRLVTKDGMLQQTVGSEDLTDPLQLQTFLDWADAKAPAKRHAVVFLNHGGRLDEMCFDERVKKGGGRGMHAMSAKATGRVLKEWRAQDHAGDPVDLLFLQQCGRGSIENLYNFAGVADCVMASQMTVGACNTYYEAVGRLLCGAPATSGADLARAIMDKDEHFGTYVLVSGAALSEIPARCDAVAAAVKGEKGWGTDERRVELTGLRPCFSVMGEHNYDAAAVMEMIGKGRGEHARTATEEFAAWVRGTLVVEHRRKSERGPGAGWCGVSVFVPGTRGAWQKYAEIPLYAESAWEDVVLGVKGR